MLWAARLAALRLVGSWLWPWGGLVVLVLELVESWERLRGLRIGCVRVWDIGGGVLLLVVADGLGARYSSALISGLEDHLVDEVVLAEAGIRVEQLTFGACSGFRLLRELEMVFGRDWSSLSRSLKMLAGFYLLRWISYRRKGDCVLGCWHGEAVDGHGRWEWIHEQVLCIRVGQAIRKVEGPRVHVRRGQREQVDCTVVRPISSEGISPWPFIDSEQIHRTTRWTELLIEIIVAHG